MTAALSDVETVSSILVLMLYRCNHSGKKVWIQAMAYNTVMQLALELEGEGPILNILNAPSQQDITGKASISVASFTQCLIGNSL
jgi:hypothetical protein